MTGLSFFPSPRAWTKSSVSDRAFQVVPPKVWGDAYLLAFAAAAGLKLVTFDRALKTKGVDVLVL